MIETAAVLGASHQKISSNARHNSDQVVVAGNHSHPLMNSAEIDHDTHLLFRLTAGLIDKSSPRGLVVRTFAEARRTEWPRTTALGANLRSGEV